MRLFEPISADIRHPRGQDAIPKHLNYMIFLLPSVWEMSGFDWLKPDERVRHERRKTGLIDLFPNLVRSSVQICHDLYGFHNQKCDEAR
jgi:hypothetical protein